MENNMPELKQVALEYYKPPFKYEPLGQTIYCQGANHQTKCLDVRGWGNLTGGGANNLPTEKAEHIQDEFGQWVADTLNRADHHTALAFYYSENRKAGDSPKMSGDDTDDLKYRYVRLEQVARQMAQACSVVQKRGFMVQNSDQHMHETLNATKEALAAFDKLMEGK